MLSQLHWLLGSSAPARRSVWLCGAIVGSKLVDRAWHFAPSLCVCVCVHAHSLTLSFFFFSFLSFSLSFFLFFFFFLSLSPFFVLLFSLSLSLFHSPSHFHLPHTHFIWIFFLFSSILYQEAKADHEARLAEIKEHWAYLHRLRRAQRIGKTATKVWPPCTHTHSLTHFLSLSPFIIYLFLPGLQHGSFFLHTWRMTSFQYMYGFPLLLIHPSPFLLYSLSGCGCVWFAFSIRALQLLLRTFGRIQSEACRRDGSLLMRRCVHLARE